MPERSVVIVNARGLHARAASKFTVLTEEFSAEISVSNERETVSGRSIMGLLLLGAASGAEIVISAAGDDAEAALLALCDLVSSGFGETDD
jgi:phosphocarrier protein HPr